MPDKLDQLKQILSVLKGEGEYLRTTHLANLIRWLTKFLGNIQEGITKQFDEFESKLDKKIEKMKQECDGMLSDCGRMIGDAKRTLGYDRRAFEVRFEEIEGKMTILPSAETVQAMLDAKETKEETAETIIAMLESVEEEDEKLSIDAIGELREILDRIERKAIQAQGTSIAYSRGQIKVYDLSSQLDGVTKTFNLPGFSYVLMVQSTSTPVIFRPTVDYTVDAAAMQLAFTDQVDAPTTLSAGQTLLVLYAEL